MPGGRQEWGESFEDALYRECFEEIGRKPDKIIQVALIGERYYRILENEYHLTYLIFECEFDDLYNFEPTKPDINQDGIEWIEIEKLDRIPFGPKDLGQRIIEYYKSESKEMIFAGMMN
jgi:ADP-ribose pyrophosphatase YjhB (NUDIX family)